MTAESPQIDRGPTTSAEMPPRRDSFNERRMLPFNEMRSLLGKSVVVTLDWDDEKAVLRGTLRSLSEDGEVCVVGEDGMGVYGWPCLYIEEI